MEKKRIVKASGNLPIGNINLPCYVLDDGTRVISGRGMQDILKLVDEEKPKSGQKAGTRLSRFFGYSNLKPFIFNENDPDHFEPIICYHGNTKINGYEATLLVDICNGVLEARKQGVKLTERQNIIAQQCEILVRSFAKIGIIALIDEATGYQYDREKRELQAILKVFISDEILKWQETFQLSFYKEIFRLWNIPFTAENIKRKPLFIGKLTNELVYKNLPKGTFVLDKLKEKTPKTEAGNYKYRLHQSLTPEVGKEALKKVIYSIETLAAISENKTKFKRLVQDRYGQRQIPFEDLEERTETKKIEQPTNFDKTLKGLLSVPPPPKDNKKQ
jgi:hypothetical protein